MYTKTTKNPRKQLPVRKIESGKGIMTMTIVYVVRLQFNFHICTINIANKCRHIYSQYENVSQQEPTLKTNQVYFN